MDSDIESAIDVEIDGEFAEGALRQLQEPLYPVGIQDAKGLLRVAAGQIKAFVKRIIFRFE